MRMRGTNKGVLFQPIGKPEIAVNDSDRVEFLDGICHKIDYLITKMGLIFGRPTRQ